ncbi:MAG: hypothetical protein VYD19_06865, partial [Myxococcota bacterium]|nr:hypothetical protein [Myxococcota bacterium]
MEGAPCPVFWSRWRRLEGGWVKEKSGRCPTHLKDQSRSWETLIYHVESAGHRILPPLPTPRWPASIDALLRREGADSTPPINQIRYQSIQALRVRWGLFSPRAPKYGPPLDRYELFSPSATLSSISAAAPSAQRYESWVHWVVPRAPHAGEIKLRWGPSAAPDHQSNPQALTSALTLRLNADSSQRVIKAWIDGDQLRAFASTQPGIVFPYTSTQYQRLQALRRRSLTGKQPLSFERRLAAHLESQIPALLIHQLACEGLPVDDRPNYLVYPSPEGGPWTAPTGDGSGWLIRPDQPPTALSGRRTPARCRFEGELHAEACVNLRSDRSLGAQLCRALKRLRSFPQRNGGAPLADHGHLQSPD